MLPRVREIAALALVTGCCSYADPSPNPTGTTTEADVPTDTPFVDVGGPPLAPPHPEKPKDPYKGWSAWCEPMDWDIECETTDDCSEVKDPSGSPTECGRPWWSNGESLVCMPAWPSRQDRQVEIEKIRAYVDSVCKPPRWWRAGQGMDVGSKHCDPDRLHALLVLVATRESTLRPWKRHRLSPDIKANNSAWFQQAGRYGWKITLDEVGGIRKRDSVRGANPYYGERHRWMGLGLYGQNSSINVAMLDTRAPPEVLCRTDLATETYLRQLRAAWAKLEAGVACEGKTFRGSSSDGRQAWIDVHRAASTGRICGPHPRDSDFQSRAKRIRVRKERPYELDPYEGIPLSWLGEKKTH